MPLFVFITGTPSDSATLAAHELQTWLDQLDPEEYTLLTEELEADPTGPERPMVGRSNNTIDRLKTQYSAPTEATTWGLAVKNRL